MTGEIDVMCAFIAPYAPLSPPCIEVARELIYYFPGCLEIVGLERRSLSRLTQFHAALRHERYAYILFMLKQGADLGAANAQAVEGIVVSAIRFAKSEESEYFLSFPLRLRLAHYNLFVSQQLTSPSRRPETHALHRRPRWCHRSGLRRPPLRGPAQVSQRGQISI